MKSFPSCCRRRYRGATGSRSWTPRRFPRHLTNTQGGSEYVLHPRSMALLRLMTATKKEEKKEGFVAIDLVAEPTTTEAATTG